MTAARDKISALMIYILRKNSREVLSMRFILNTSDGSLGEAVEKLSTIQMIDVWIATRDNGSRFRGRCYSSSRCRKEKILSGYLRFQACSQTVCEPPQTVTSALPPTLHPFLISERDRELLERKASKS